MWRPNLCPWPYDPGLSTVVDEGPQCVELIYYHTSETEPDFEKLLDLVLMMSIIRKSLLKCKKGKRFCER